MVLSAKSIYVSSGVKIIAVLPSVILFNLETDR